MAVRLDRHYEPLPGYKLIERLGRGGFGEVWKVEAPGQLHKAMKFVFGNLDSGDDDGRPAEQELKALNRVKAIRHPYILSLERIDVVEGQLIIVMELADKNLWDRFRECRQNKQPGIPREELLRYLSEAAEALDLMNDQYHIQHLDVKPQNLFLLYSHVKVADFGLAKAFEGGRGTITGGVTPVYAAPETFEGYASRFTDQYSLAIVFQELLTGSRPFNGSNTKQLLMQHLNGVPDLTSLPPGDRAIIGRALSKKPDDRWPNCVSMVQALKASNGTDTPLPNGNGARHLTYGGHSKTPVSGESSSNLRSGMRSAMHTIPQSPDLTRTRNNVRDVQPPRGSGSQTNQPRVLATPKLINPKTAAAGRGFSGSLLPTRHVDGLRNASMAEAPPEVNGDGVLLPAVIVGVGQHGRLVLQRLREMIQHSFGSLDALGHIRFLLIDTDADEIAQSIGPEIESPFAPHEVVHARINRPTHYLQHAGLENVERWMPPGLLYKLPKDPRNTGGVRSFGRLALYDHARCIVSRLRDQLEQAIHEPTLNAAVESTGLGLRTNRPRIYLIASTTGGTGSGMVIDLAYLLKYELRQHGYSTPNVVGTLFVPPADRRNPKGVALANTVAMLTELNAFASGATPFQAKFDGVDVPVTDNGSPFSRCSLIQLPDNPASSRLAGTVGLVARALLFDLLTPVGRITDTVRDEALRLPRRGGPVIQTFGLFRFSWPRHELLSALTQRFGVRLLNQWGGKESAHLRDPIRHWLNDQWAKLELDVEPVVDKLNGAVEVALREKADRVFDAFIDPLRSKIQGSGQFDDKSVCDLIEEFLKLVGHPDPDSDELGKLDAALREKVKQLALESETHLSTLAVSFIEQPQYRLAGADEALLQVQERLKSTIETLDQIRKALKREVQDTYAKLFHQTKALAKDETGFFGGKKSSMITELFESLRQYPRKRLRLNVLDVALSYYRGLLEQCPDYFREITSCRTKITELSAKINVASQKRVEREPGAVMLPPGCLTLEDAADEFIAAISPDDLLAFENNLQYQISRKFRGVVNVCSKSHFTEDFLTMLRTNAAEFLAARLEDVDPTTIFFRYKEGQPGTPQELEDAFDQAAPDLTSISGAAPAEATVLASPAGPDGDRLRQYVTEMLQGVEFIPAPLATEIAFYREYPLLELAALPQLAEHAQDAYRSKLTSDHPPHARADVVWSPVAGLVPETV